MGVSKDKEEHVEGGTSLLVHWIQGTAKLSNVFQAKVWDDLRNARNKAGNECRSQITKVFGSCDKESFPTWKRWEVWGWETGFKTGAWYDYQFREVKTVNFGKAR